MARFQSRSVGLALLASLLASALFLVVLAQPARAQWDQPYIELNATVFPISLLNRAWTDGKRNELIIGNLRDTHSQCRWTGYNKSNNKFIFTPSTLNPANVATPDPTQSGTWTIHHRSLSMTVRTAHNSNRTVTGFPTLHGFVWMAANDQPNLPDAKKLSVGLYTISIQTQAVSSYFDVRISSYTTTGTQPNGLPFFTNTVVTSTVIVNCPNPSRSLTFATILISDSTLTRLNFHNLASPNTSFSPILITSTVHRTFDVGITVQRAYTACKLVSITIGGPLTLNPRYVYRAANYTNRVAHDATDTQLLDVGTGFTSFVNFLLPKDQKIDPGTYTMTIAANPWGVYNNSSCSWPEPVATAATGTTVTITLTVASPGSWANQGRNNTVANGPFRREVINNTQANPSGIDTGIRFHMGQPLACFTIQAWINNESEGEFELRRYNESNTADTPSAAKGRTVEAHMQKDNSSDRHLRLFMNKGEMGWGVKSVTVRARATDNCLGNNHPHTNHSRIASPLTLGDTSETRIVYQVTIYDTWKGVQPSVTATPPRNRDKFSPVRLSLMSSPLDIGITIARNSQSCFETDIALLSHTDVMEMQVLDINNNQYLAAASSYGSVQMGTYSGNTYRNDRSKVRLQFKSSVAIGAGQTLSLTVQVSPVDSCGVGKPPAETYAYTITAGSPVDWQVLSKDSANVSQAFFAPFRRIDNDARDTGVQFHRNSSVCAYTDVELANHTGFLELAEYNRSDAIQSNVGARFTSRMDASANAATDRHFRLRFKRLATSTPHGTISVTIKASYNDATSGSDVCHSENVPHPITLQYVITLNSYYPWTVLAQDNGNNHVLAPGGNYVASDILAAQDPVDTGIVIHRNSGHPREERERCQVNDLRMVTHSDLFVLNLTRLSDGLRVSPQPGSVVINAQMPGIVGNAGSQNSGQYVKLQFRPGARVPAGIITAAVEIKGNRNVCGDHADVNASSEVPPPLTLVYRMRVRENTTDVTWRSLAGEVTNPSSGTFAASALTGAAGPATGVRIHRNSTSCTNIGVHLVSGSEYLELRRYNGNQNSPNSEPAAAAHTVVMEAGNNNSRLIGVHFKAGLTLLGLTIRGAVETRAECTGQRVPSAETISFNLTVNDDIDNPPLIRRSGTTISLGSTTVEITDTSGIDFEVSEYSDAETNFPRIELHQFTPNLFEMVTINTPSFQRVEIRLRPKAGVTLALNSNHEMTIEATDASDSSIKSRATVVINMVRSAAAEAAESNRAVGGAAVRAIGIGSFDAVLSRAAIGGGDARLEARDGAASHEFLRMLQAKESELESGEIDLREFLRGQAFSLPLLNSNGGFGSGLGIWGQVDMLDIEGGEGTEFSHEGELFSAQFGVDTLLGGGFLAGVSYGIHEVESNYLRQVLNRTDGGKYALEIDVVHPYAAMDALGGRIAVAAGFGNGQMSLEGSGAGADAINNSKNRDVSYRSYSLGYGMSLGDPNSDDSISMRGAFSSSELDLDEDEGSAASLDAETSSLRLALEYARSIDFGSNQALRPAVEVAYARSWGKSDEDDGNGYELVAGLGYVMARLEADAKFVYLSTSGDADSKASGGSFSFRYSPTAGGLGLSLQARPSYGPTNGTGTLWEASASRDLSQFANSERQLSLNAGYGLAIPGGVLTPYGSYGVSGSNSGTRELGLRLRTGGTHDRWLLRFRDSGGASAEELKIEYWLE